MKPILNLDDFTELTIQSNGKEFKLDNSFKAAVNFEKKYNELIEKYKNDLTKISENESNELLLIIFGGNKELLDFINGLAPQIQVDTSIAIMGYWLKHVFPQALNQDTNDKKKIKPNT